MTKYDYAREHYGVLEEAEHARSTYFFRAAYKAEIAGKTAESAALRALALNARARAAVWAEKSGREGTLSYRV